MTDVDNAEEAPAEQHTRRSRWPLVLVVLASVLAVVSTLTTWVRAQMLDTDEWVQISDELLAEPQLQNALATYLTNELYARVDVEAELGKLLPDDLSGLAGPLAGALRSPTESAVEQLVASDRFAQLWSTANREAHQVFVAVLRDEAPPGVSTADGTVTLDLQPLVRSVGERVGVPSSALERIPDDVGTIVIFESDELANVQTTVRVLDFLSWFLLIVVVGLYALAVYMARERRHALQMVGVGLVVSGVTLLVVRKVGVEAVVNITVDESNRSIGDLIGEVATQLLRQTAWTGVAYGVLIIGFAWLLGPHRWAASMRGSLDRFADSTAAVAVGAGLVVLLLVWWSPGRAFDNWWSALILIGLGVAAVVVLLRQVAAERHDQAAPLEGVA